MWSCPKGRSQNSLWVKLGPTVRNTWITDSNTTKQHVIDTCTCITSSLVLTRWEKNAQFWLCALHSNWLQSAVEPGRSTRWPASFAQTVQSRISIAAHRLFSVMAATCRSKLIKQTSDICRPLSRRVFFFFFWSLVLSMLQQLCALIYPPEHLCNGGQN